MDPASHGFDLTPYLQLGSFGVLVYMIFHIIRIQIPRQEARSDLRDKQFLDALDKQHADCTASLELQRRESLEAISHARNIYRQENALIRDAYEKTIDRLIGEKKA